MSWGLRLTGLRGWPPLKDAEEPWLGVGMGPSSSAKGSASCSEGNTACVCVCALAWPSPGSPLPPRSVTSGTPRILKKSPILLLVFRSESLNEIPKQGEASWVLASALTAHTPLGKRAGQPPRAPHTPAGGPPSPQPSWGLSLCGGVESTSCRGGSQRGTRLPMSPRHAFPGSRRDWRQERMMHRYLPGTRDKHSEENNLMLTH